MSLISKPVDWEVFSIPPIQPVQYYSILKKQREFSQLIQQYDAQVFRHGYLHYCGIVPKYLTSTFNNRCEIFIVFLDETSTTSFIGFRVKVCKERFTYESKSLLLFLKNSEKAIFYSMNNNRIHVQCGSNAWELFYLLYDDYLRKYVLTIIGTQFFYHFVYSYCIEKEKQFLKRLCKGSKVIRVSKSSIYYKIHRKRKISVTDLIHMTLNMPKRKKYTLSSFDFRESLLYSDGKYGDFYTVAGNKINFSKLMLKKLKKQDVLPEKSCQKITLTDVTHKRKFGEVETNQNLEPNTSKHFKTSESCSTENEWEQYQALKSFSVQSYSTISFINTLVPSLLNSSCNSNLPSIKTHSNITLPSSSSHTKEDELKNSTVVQKACTLGDHEETDIYENSENLIEKASLHASKSVTYSGCVIPKVFSSHHSTSSSNCESLSCTNNSDVTKSCDINSIHFSTSTRDNDNLATKEGDLNFSTAAGKVINISSAAMLKAYKLCEKEQIMPENITSDVVIKKVPESTTTNTVKHEVSEKNYCTDLKKKSVNKDICLPKKVHSFLKSDANMPKKLAAAPLSHSENLKQDHFDITEDVTFATAAGKRINVSNDAMEAAQKLIYSTSDEDKMPLPRENLSVHRNQFYKNETSNNGCTSKTDDVDMDNTLVEKFFEDVQFDEKELQLTKDNIKQDNLNVITEPKSDKNLPTRKPRKSLGGRRNMRYCSDKL